MNTIKIDKGVPPPSPAGRGRRPIYPFYAMEVGGSFFAEKAREKSVRSCAGNLRAHGAKRFTVSHVEGGVRCWRIK